MFCRSDTPETLLYIDVPSTRPAHPGSISYAAYGHIMIVGRDVWETIGSELISSTDPPPVAVVIQDTVGYRPSSPLPLDLADEFGVPVVLVQEDDVWALPVEEYDGIIMWVSPIGTTERIPDPAFKCETDGCLEHVFTDGHIAGEFGLFTPKLIMIN
jgi:hypothetical protein